jgi:hypothetical protein
MRFGKFDVNPRFLSFASRWSRCLQVKSARAARKVMDSKGLAHYWDMVARGDKLDHASALFA